MPDGLADRIGLGHSGSAMVADSNEWHATVRAARRSDLDALEPIWTDFMNAHERRDGHFALAADSLRRWRSLVSEMIYRDDGLVLVGEWGGRVSGYCLGWLARNPPIYSVNLVGFISELAVRTDARRRGVGTVLIEAARRWFDSREVTEFQLATAIWNRSAQAFWHSLGGRPILTRYRFDV